MKAPTNIFSSTKLVSIALPPQNWLMLLMQSQAAFASEAAMTLTRAEVLMWYALLAAASMSPAGYDQDVAEVTSWMSGIMQQQGQAVLNSDEEAILLDVVKRYRSAEELLPPHNLALLTRLFDHPVKHTLSSADMNTLGGLIAFVRGHTKA